MGVWGVSKNHGVLRGTSCGFKGGNLAFSSILLVPTRSGIAPGVMDLGAGLARGVSLGVPIVASTVSAMARSNVTVTVTHRNNLNVVRGGVAVSHRTRRVSGMGEDRGNIVMGPFCLSTSRLMDSTSRLVNGFGVSNIPVISRGNGLYNVVAGHSLHFVHSCSIGVNRIVAGRGLIATPMKAALRRTDSVLYGCGVRGLPVISNGNCLGKLVAIGSVRGTIGCPGSTASSRNELIYNTTVNIAGSILSETGTLISTRISYLILSSTRNRSRGVVGYLRGIGGTFPRITIVTNGITATRTARTLVGTNTSIIGMNVNPNSVYAAHMITNMNMPRLATMCSTTYVNTGCNVPMVTSNNVGCSNSVMGTLTTNTRYMVLNSLLTNYRRTPNRIRVCRNHSFGMCHNVNSLNTVTTNSGSECFRANSGGLIPRNIRNHMPFGKPLSRAVFRLINNVEDNVNCYNYRAVPRLRRGTRFIRVANTNLGRSRPRSVLVAGRTPGCSMRVWERVRPIVEQNYFLPCNLMCYGGGFKEGLYVPLLASEGSTQRVGVSYPLPGQTERRESTLRRNGELPRRTTITKTFPRQGANFV